MDRNYLYDARVVAGERGNWFKSFDARSMKAVIEVYDEDGNTEEHEVPCKFCVCPTCEGQGSHTNPSIDAGGITGGEWEEWDPEDRAAYFEGRYDVRCYECKGARVVPEIDQQAADPEAVKAFEQQEADRALFEAESRAEREMGA